MSGDKLLTHFDRCYPQAISWRLFPSPSTISSALTGALSKRRPRDGFPSSGAPPPRPPGRSPWSEFCSHIHVNPHQLGNDDPVWLLQIFAHCHRHGSLAPGCEPVRSRTVEEALRAVGQTYAGMGSPEPRLNSQGKFDFPSRPCSACGKMRTPLPLGLNPSH